MAAEYQRVGFVDETWRIKAYKKAKVGDRVWLLRQGRGPKCIFGVGKILAPPAIGQSGQDKTQGMGPIRFDRFVDPDRDFLIDERTVLSILRLQQVEAPASGYPIDDSQSDALEDALARGSTRKSSANEKTNVRYWWVNQNQTYKQEIKGGFLWSPKTKKGGLKNPFYDFMTEVKPGDIIFSFYDTYIQAIGLATGSAESSNKPNFGEAGKEWASDGWLVPAEFQALAHSFRPKDNIGKLAPVLPEKYSPLNASGNGSEAVYLAPVPEEMASVMIEIMGADYRATVAILEGTHDVESGEDVVAERQLQERTDIGETEKSQMSKARRGQGVFKSNVRMYETFCRVTGMTHRSHLIASHIKPWSKSSDLEKLDGCNGLLLSPHVDHLFDKGYISFANDGSVIKSSKLPTETFVTWGLNPVPAQPFNNRQIAFLEYHRTERLKK
jgi:hypothetical protein